MNVRSPIFLTSVIFLVSVPLFGAKRITNRQVILRQSTKAFSKPSFAPATNSRARNGLSKKAQHELEQAIFKHLQLNQEKLNNNELSKEGISTSSGGNGVAGAVLESYAPPLADLPVFKKYVAPLVAEIGRHSRPLADQLMGYFTDPAAGKTWFFLPVELPKIPSSKIGVLFQTQQLAIQSMREVFISTLHLPEENDPEGDLKLATLLVHEGLMAARLWDINNQFRECRELRSPPPNLKCARQLATFDYEDIRKMTSFLMSHRTRINREDLANVLSVTGFFIEMTDNTRLGPLMDIANIINFPYSTNLWGFVANSERPCGLDAKYDNAFNELQLTFSYPSDIGNEKSETFAYTFSTPPTIEKGDNSTIVTLQPKNATSPLENVIVEFTNNRPVKADFASFNRTCTTFRGSGYDRYQFVYAYRLYREKEQAPTN